MNALFFLLKEGTRVAQPRHPDLPSFCCSFGSLCQRSKRPRKQILNIPIFCHMKILGTDFYLIYLHMSWPGISERERTLWWLCSWLELLQYEGVIPSLPLTERLQSMAELATSQGLCDTTSIATFPPSTHHQPHTALASFGYTLLLVTHQHMEANQRHRHTAIFFQCQDSWSLFWWSVHPQMGVGRGKGALRSWALNYK